MNENKLKEWEQKQLVERIKKGKIFIYPTDTGYGLGCSIYRSGSIEKIFKIKDRPAEKTVPVLCSENQARKLAIFSEPERSAARRFWPGALTLVLKAKQPQEMDSRIIRNGKLALREPGLEPLVELIERSAPIVGTSANLSGRPMPSRLEDLDPELVGEVDFVLGEARGEGESSTVAGWSKEDSEWKIFREGPVKKSELENL